MAIRRFLAVFSGLVFGLFNAVVVAQRDCSNTTYPWTITRADYANKVSLSAAAPSDGAFSLGLKQLDSQVNWWYIWSCAVYWPEAWAGWHDSEGGGKGLIWSGCDLSSLMMDVPAYDDMALSFAVDWPSRKLFLAHTHACRNREFRTLAMGSTTFSIDCALDPDGQTRCSSPTIAPLSPFGSVPSYSPNITTAQVRTGPEQGGCPGPKTAYYAWQVDGWHHRYGLDAPANGVYNATKDPGPSFKLYALVTGESFTCQNSNRQSGVYKGGCKPGPDSSRTTASFRFDSVNDILTVTQHWDCGNL